MEGCKCVKVFKNGPSKICRRQPIKYLKGHGNINSKNVESFY